MILGGNSPRAIAIFAIRFLLASLILVPLWWLAVPAYGWLLVQGCGVILRGIFGMDITAGNIEVSGIMNTESLLILYVGEHPTSMKFVQIITNLSPFVALILATPRLSLRRRATALMLGTAVLCGGHALFIILALRFAVSLQHTPEIPTAMTQFFLTLPFLLWIVLAYWRRLGTAPTQG